MARTESETAPTKPRAKQKPKAVPGPYVENRPVSPWKPDEKEQKTVAYKPYYAPKQSIAQQIESTRMSFPSIQAQEDYLSELFANKNEFGRNYNFYSPDENPNWDYKNPPINAQTGRPMDKFGQDLPYGAETFDANGMPWYGPGLIGYARRVWSAVSQPWEAPREQDSAKGWQAVKNAVNAVVKGGLEVISEPSKMAESANYVRNKYPLFAMINSDNPYGLMKALQDGVQVSDIPAIAESVASRIPFVAPVYNALRFVTDPNVVDIRMGETTVGEVAEEVKREWYVGRMAYTGIIDPLKLNEARARIAAGENPYFVTMELENPWAELAGTLAVDPLNVMGVGPKVARVTNRAKNAEKLFLRPVDEIGDSLKALAKADRPERAFDALDATVKGQMAAQQMLASAGIDAWMKKMGTKHGPFDLTAGGRRAFVTDTVSELLHNLAGQKDVDTFADSLEALYKLGSKAQDEVSEGLSIAMGHDNAKMFLSQAGQMASRVIRDVVGDDLEDFVRLTRKAKAEGMDAYLKFVDNRTFPAIDRLFPTLSERIASDRLIAAVDAGRKYTDLVVDAAKSQIRKIETALGDKVVLEKGVDGVYGYRKGDIFVPLDRMQERLYKDAQAIIDLQKNDPDKLAKVSEEQYKVALTARERLGRVNSVEAAVDDVYSFLSKHLYGPMMNVFSNIYMGLSWQYAFRNAWNNYFTTFVDEGLGAVFGSSRQAAAALDEMLGQTPARMTGLTRGPLGEAGKAIHIPDNWRWIGGKTIDPFFGTRMASNFEEAAAAKVMFTAAKDAMEKMVREGKALPRIDDLVRQGLDQTVARTFVEAIKNNNYDVDKAMKVIEPMLANGEIDVLKSMTWIPQNIRKALTQWGIDGEVVAALASSATTKDELVGKIDEIWYKLRTMADQVNNGPVGVEMGSDAQKTISEFEDAFELVDKEREAVIDYISANEHANAAAYDLAEQVMQAMRELTPIEQRDEKWNSIYSGLSMINLAKAAPQSVYNQVLNRARALKNKKYGAGMTTEALRAEWQNILNAPLTLDKRLRATPFGERVEKDIADLSERGQNVVINSRAQLREAVWNEWWYPRMRRIWSGYRDTLSKTMEGMFSEANALLPQGAKMPETMLTVFRDKLQQAQAFDTDIIDVELANAFSKAFENGDIPNMIRTRAMAYGIPAGSSDKSVLNVINKYLTPTDFDKTMAAYEKAAKKSYETFQKYLSKIDDEYPGAMLTRGGVDEREITKAVNILNEKGIAGRDPWYIVKYIEKYGIDSLPPELKTQFKDLSDYMKAVKNFRVQDMPPAVRDEVKNTIDEMLAMTEVGEPGRRNWQEVLPTEFDSSQLIITRQKSTYPGWYGPLLKGGARYWDENGKVITGKDAIVQALKDMSAGNFKKSSLTERLSSLIGYNDDIIYQLTFGDRGKTAFNQAAEMVENMIARSTNPAELDPGKIFERLSGLADESELVNRPPGLLPEDVKEMNYAKIVELQEKAAAKAKALQDKLASGDKLAKYFGTTFQSLDNVPYEIVDDIFMDYANRHPDKTTSVIKAYRPYNGGPPNASRVMHESREMIDVVMRFLRDGVDQHYGEMMPVIHDGAAKKALRNAASIARTRTQEARLVATKVADAARDFALLDYRDRRGFDLALSMIFPYHYWYTRSYTNWMKRLYYNPEVWAAYAKYRNTLESIHKDMPEWWRYNFNTNDLPGIYTDNPIFMNLEQTLWPMYGMTGADFDDSSTRINNFATFIDEINNFGPSPWTFFGWINAIDATMKGNDEAKAKLFGRLLPQTKNIRNALTTAGVMNKTLSGYNEYDPFVLLFSKGIDPYDYRMIARSLAEMQQELEDASVSGKSYPFTEEDLFDAARNQSGPAWDQAVQRMLNYRASGGITGPAKWIPFIASNIGVGMKPRTTSDMQVDMYDQEKIALIRMKGNLSPDEYRQKWRELNDKYEFGELLSLARGTETERDEAYTYNVLNRVPPGQRDDLFNLFGIDYDMVQQFYQSKGNALTTWQKSDRDTFMAAINSMGATLSLPDDATRAKWAVATDQYTQMMNEIDLRFGAGTTDTMYKVMDWNQTLQERYLRKHPEVISARRFRDDWIQQHPEMIPYYSTADKIWGYYRNQAYTRISKELGPDVFSSWGYRTDEQIAAQDALNEWEKAHPEWPIIKEKLSLRSAAKAEANQTMEDMFDNELNYQVASKLADEYDKKINDYVMRQFGYDYTQAKLDWDEANKLIPEDGGAAYNEFLLAHPEWDAKYDGINNDPEIEALREERNARFTEGTGQVYSAFWDWYDHYKNTANRNVSEIDVEFTENGWWELVDEHSAMYDKVDEAGKLSPAQQKYIELRDQYMQDAAKVALDVMKKLRPIEWPNPRTSSTGTGYKKISELINQPFSEQYNMTWKDLTADMSPTMERVLLDHLRDGDELPYAAESQLERLAGELGMDYYLYVQQLRNALESENP